MYYATFFFTRCRGLFKKRTQARTITRAPGAPSLQFELELKSLDQLEDFRSHGIRSKAATAKWMQAFSRILLSPPAVEILRVETL